MKSYLICSIIALAGLLSVEARAESPQLGQSNDLICQSIDSGNGGSVLVLEINAVEPCALDIAAQQFRLVTHNFIVLAEAPVSIVTPLDQGNSSPPAGYMEDTYTKTHLEKPGEITLYLRTFRLSYLGGNFTAFHRGNSCQNNHKSRHNSEHWSPPKA